MPPTQLGAPPTFFRPDPGNASSVENAASTAVHHTPRAVGCESPCQNAESCRCKRGGWRPGRRPFLGGPPPTVFFLAWPGWRGGDYSWGAATPPVFSSPGLGGEVATPQ